MWSPLVTEEGKTNPYKMNLANKETQVRFSSAYLGAESFLNGPLIIFSSFKPLVVHETVIHNRTIVAKQIKAWHHRLPK